MVVVVKTTGTREDDKWDHVIVECMRGVLDRADIDSG
jgi:hypothetical protein